MLTQGRLVPRQPWTIKRTTPTALRGCNIRNYGFIHGNADIISMALRGCNIRHGGFIHGNADIISMTLRGCNIHHGGFIHGNADIISTALRRCNIRHGGFIHGFLISSAEILDTNYEFLSSINRNLCDFKASVDLVIKKK